MGSPVSVYSPTLPTPPTRFPDAVSGGPTVRLTTAALGPLQCSRFLRASVFAGTRGSSRTTVVDIMGGVFDTASHFYVPDGRLSQPGVP